MAESTGTTYTLEQYDAAPVDWTWQVPTNYPAAQTIPSGTSQGLGLIIIPTSPPWPTNDALLAQASIPNANVPTFVVDATHLTVATAHATDNPDGTGTGYDLTASAVPGLANFYGAYGSIGTSANPDTATIGGIFDNPTDHTLYLQSATGTMTRFVLIPHTGPVGPPPPETPPTTPPPPTNLPPEVIERKLLDAANPGFNCEIERNERATDLVTLFLGDKISLTVDGVRGRLGIIGRSHVVTRLRFRWQITHDGDVLAESVTTTAVLEKIAGTLLGGAGTSSPDQDSAFDGGDMALFGAWDTAGAGWDSAGWAA